MGNNPTTPRQWWLTYKEKQRSVALGKCIAQHRNIETALKGQMGKLRDERKGYEQTRQWHKENLPADVKCISTDTLKELLHLTREINKINLEIDKLRFKVEGVHAQLRQLNLAGYNKLIQSGWVAIVESYRQMGLDIVELTRDADKVSDAIDGINEFNTEHEFESKEVFGVHESEDQDKVDRQDLADFLGLGGQHSEYKSAATAAAASTVVMPKSKAAAQTRVSTKEVPRKTEERQMLLAGYGLGLSS